MVVYCYLSHGWWLVGGWLMLYCGWWVVVVFAEIPGFQTVSSVGS